MNKLIACTAIASALLLGGTARAQGAGRAPDQLFLVNWEISQPLGGFADYIDSTSLAGVSFEGRNFISEKISLGLLFSWNRYDQSFDNESFPIQNGVVTGPVFRDSSMFAIRATGHFYPLQGKSVRPYVGLGIGGGWNYAYQQTADLSLSQSNFDFIVSPEIGTFLNLTSGWSSGVGLNLALRYTYTTATNGRVDGSQALSGIIGLTFGY
jgi:hypothetical protein